MSQQPFDFAGLLRRARRGCSLATREVHDRFNHAALAAARQHLHPLVRAKLDPEDLAQDVWSVFFLDVLPTHDFGCPQQLLRLLRSVARNLSLQANRYFLQLAAHDSHREQPLGDALLVREGGPAPVREQWEQLSEGQLPEVRRVLRQFAQGQTLPDVADARGTSVSGLTRWLRRRVIHSSA